MPEWCKVVLDGVVIVCVIATVVFAVCDFCKRHFDFRPWNRRQKRRTDLRVLWPACKKASPTLDHARAIFAYHAFNDEAWIVDYEDEQLCQFISNLN